MLKVKAQYKPQKDKSTNIFGPQYGEVVLKLVQIKFYYTWQGLPASRQPV